MKLTLLTALLVLPYGLAAPTHFAKLKRAAGDSVKDSYIVVLKETASRSNHIQSLSSAATDDVDSLAEVVYSDWNVLNGYAATLGAAVLDRVLKDPDVDYVEENGIVDINGHLDSVVERGPVLEPNPEHIEWLQRLKERASGGAGVDIYSIDTGVRITHQAFTGRARWGATFGGYSNQDGYGHGTHTMGIAAGVNYGPATSANIIAVKVLSDSGTGSNADVISGINWVANAAKSSGRPSVANMSLGGAATSAVDSAVSGAISAGVHFAAAAGNNNVDSANVSPARVAAAITVGAISSTKAKASWSNYGSVLDVWFYGVSILSAWNTSDSATATLSGTSMASPGVAGILAVALGEYGNVTPASLVTSLKSHAVADVTGAPAGTTNLRAVLW